MVAKSVDISTYFAFSRTRERNDGKASSEDNSLWLFVATARIARFTHCFALSGIYRAYMALLFRLFIGVNDAEEMGSRGRMDDSSSDVNMAGKVRGDNYSNKRSCS